MKKRPKGDVFLVSSVNTARNGDQNYVLIPVVWKHCMLAVPCFHDDGKRLSACDCTALTSPTSLATFTCSSYCISIGLKPLHFLPLSGLCLLFVIYTRIVVFSSQIGSSHYDNIIRNTYSRRMHVSALFVGSHASNVCTHPPRTSLILALTFVFRLGHGLADQPWGRGNSSTIWGPSCHGGWKTNWMLIGAYRAHTWQL